MKTFIGCSVIIYDHIGRVLIAQRGRNKKSYPLMWETIGGALEDNETPEECIRREAQEEIGCKLHDLRLFNGYVIREAENQHVLFAFTARIESEVELNYEIEEVRWITLADIDNYDFYADSCRQRLIEFYKAQVIDNNC